MADTRDLIEGFTALDETASNYERLWTYYAGDLPEKFASDRIRQLVKGSGKDYRFRLARIPVEALANRLGINSITGGTREADAKIEEIRVANDMELIEPFMTERLLVFGDAYMLVWPVEDEEADEDVQFVGVELAYQSPMACRAMYDGVDGRRLRYTIRRWQETGPLGKAWRAELFYADRVEGWVTDAGASGTDPAQWHPYVKGDFAIEGQNWPEFHDYGENPMKHARTDLPYGRSEMEDFLGAQNAITKAAATQASGIESHGWRERWRIADDNSVLEQTKDTVSWGDTPNADKRPAELLPRSARRSGPGVEHLLHGTKSVGEYAPVDITGLIDPVESWIRWGAAAASTPLFEFDARTGQQLSGVARERAERPLAAKEEDRKRFLLRFWREVYGLALNLLSVEYAEIQVNWSPPKVNNDPDWWATAQIRRGFGVPERTILLEANYTAEQLAEWEAEQDEALLLDSRIARIAALGEAMSALGAGAQLLGLPGERVAKLVEDILGDAGSPGSIVLDKPAPQLPPGDGTEDGDRA